MIAGHASVTDRAYSQSKERVAHVAQLASAVVHNSLGSHQFDLPEAKRIGLVAQIERDMLVLLLTHAPEASR